MVSDAARGATFRVVLGLIALLGGLWLLRASGFLEALDADGVRAQVARAGPWSPLVYIGVYVAGLFAGVPGSVLVGGGVLAFGGLEAGLLAYAAAFLANGLAFFLARSATGRSLASVQAAPSGLGRIERWVRAAERRPFQGVLIVRLLLPTAVVASFALALTPVRAGVYLGASALGVLPQLGATVALFTWALSSG